MITSENRVKEESGVAASEGDVVREYSVPEVDVFENEESLLLVANVPGADEKSVDLSLEKNILTIEAKVENRAPEGYKRYYVENEAEGYSRQFRLSDEIDRDGISASVNNGVLRITLKKAKEIQPKKIEIKTA